MKFLPVLKWMFSITLFAVIAAGGAAVYFWKNSDELIQQQIVARFDQVAPDLKLVIGRTALQGTQAVTLSDIEVRDRSNDRPLFRAQQLQVDIDSHLLLEQQQVVINKVHLNSADVLLTREESGRWNWQNYHFQQTGSRQIALPEVSLKDLRIQLTLKHGHNIPAARLLLTSPQMQAVPTSQHSYDFDGAIALPGAGLLKLGGMCDLNSAEWKIGGQLRDVQADQQLMDLARAANPEIGQQLSQLDTAIEKALPKVATASTRPSGAALLIGNDSQVAPQFLGVLDVNFSVASDAESAIPSFQLMVGIREGRVVSPAFPMQFSNVRARFFKDNDNLEFRLDHADGDGASISGDVLISTAEGAGPPSARFNVQRFPVSEKLRPLLPPKMLRLFDAFRPQGRISVQGSAKQGADGRWQPHGVTAQIHEGTVLHHRFRYLAEGLTGTIVQRPYQHKSATTTEPQLTERDTMFDVQVSAMLGDHPVRATGWMRNPGPEAETRFDVSVTDFPLDSRFHSALEEKHQRVVDALALTGKANAELMFYRPPGLNNLTIPFFKVHVFDGSIRFTKFPYDINNLTGHVTYDGSTKAWQFHEIEGRHGDGRLYAVGQFRGHPSPGDLDLTITAKNAALDADLYNALSRSHRNLWNMIEPDGFCDLTTKINWTASPGQPAIVSFPEKTPVRIYNTRIRPRPFPFRMLVKEATLSYDPNDPRNAGVQHCEIHSFHATHGNAPIQARGWTEAKPNGEWQVHLNNVTARNLNPDDDLRAALPASWQESMDRMTRTGTISIEDSEMDFRGDLAGEMNTTAGWDLNLRMADCTVNAGLDVSHVYGRVTARGHWDGDELTNKGQIRLDTAEVLEMPFTNVRGPYSMDNVELVLGARPVFERSNPLANVNRDTRMKAQAYGGELFFDALVDMRDNGRYWFFTELENARLESYAALHIPDQRNLKGIVTAWMSLEGHGDDTANVKGKGQMRISPAALYELPVVVQLLGTLSNLTVQDKTAFNYAIVDFTVRDKAFWINPVDLVGEAISFRGRGSVGFGGAVDLDFYSRPARTRTVPLPIISGLFTNWAKVEIRGTTDRPQPRAAPLGQLDEGMKQFLQPFTPNPGGPIPGLVVPRPFQLNGPLLPGRRQPQNARQSAPQRR